MQLLPRSLPQCSRRPQPLHLLVDLVMSLSMTTLLLMMTRYPSKKVRIDFLTLILSLSLLFPSLSILPSLLLLSFLISLSSLSQSFSFSFPTLPLLVSIIIVR